MPNGTTIVGFADDITIVSVAEMVKEIQEKKNMAIRKVGTWLDEATEANLISGRKMLEKMEVTVGDTSIESERAIK